MSSVDLTRETSVSKLADGDRGFEQMGMMAETNLLVVVNERLIERREIYFRSFQIYFRIYSEI